MAKKTTAEERSQRPGTQTSAKVLKDLTYVADVTSGKLGGVVPVALMEISAANRTKIGFLPGAIFSLTIGEMALTGMVFEGEKPDPLRRDEFERRKRLAKNFASAHIVVRAISFELHKTSRSAPFRFPANDTVQARLKVIEPPAFGATKSALKKAVRSRGDAVAIPKRIGKPGPFVQNLAELLKTDDVVTWRFSITFELDGQVRAAMLFVTPPCERVDRLGKPYRLPALVEACVGKPSADGIANPLQQEFRGWPGAVARGFQWAAKQAKGGTLLTALTEHKAVGRGRKAPPASKEIQSTALNAWREVLGIQD